MRIPIASDHAGLELKSELIKTLNSVDWEDLGPHSKDSVDYPDFADLIASKINQNSQAKGILICGSGQGMAMRANKYPNVRAALVWHEEIAKLSRQHNDANILCLPGRFVSAADAVKFVKLFLETSFEGGRHAGRVAKINSMPKGGC